MTLQQAFICPRAAQQYVNQHDVPEDIELMLFARWGVLHD